MDSASEEKKIAATESGILPALKTIIDNPPPPPVGLPGTGLLGAAGAAEPENVPLPDSPSSSEASLADNPSTSPAALIATSAHVGASHSESYTKLPIQDIDLPDDISMPVLSEAVNSAASGLARAAVDARESTTSLSPTKSASILPQLVDSSADAVDQISGTPVPATKPSAIETPKSPRSPRAKAVTFDSVDQVIVLDSKTYSDDDNGLDSPERVTGSPRSLREISLHDPSRLGNLNERSQAAADAFAIVRQEIKSKEEAYEQAFTALEHIISDVPKDALDTIGEAYVAAGIHESLIKALRAYVFHS